MKKKPARSKHHSRSTKNRPSRGSMGAGTLYAVVALLIIAFGATSMIGNIVPLTSKSPGSGQPVNVSPPDTDNARDNLQLFTFPGATYTPTPSPTTPPQPQQSWSNSGGSGSGGHSAPAGGNTNSGGIAR